MQKRHNPSRVNLILIVGALLAVSSPAIFTYFANPSWDLKNTSEIGNVVGGIAGTVLNFVGILLVYFSFQQQFEANEMQKQALEEEKDRYERDRTLDSLHNLVAHLKTSLVELRGEASDFGSKIEPINIRLNIYYRNDLVGNAKNDRSEGSAAVDEKMRAYTEKTFSNSSMITKFKFSVSLYATILDRLAASRWESDELKVIQLECDYLYQAYIADFIQSAQRSFEEPLPNSTVNLYQEFRKYFEAGKGNLLDRGVLTK